MVKCKIFLYNLCVSKVFYTYILLTENNTLYCGYSDDVEKRFQKHLKGKGAKYTRANKPIKIVYKKRFKTKSQAMKEEARIKKLSKKDKLKLINHYSFVHLSFWCFVFLILLILFVVVFRVVLVA